MNPSFPINNLNQVQSIQGRILAPRPGSVPKNKGRKLCPVKPGLRTVVAYGPTTAGVGSCWKPQCGEPKQVVLVNPTECVPPPKADIQAVQTIAVGVSEGLRRAPLLVSDVAPWNEPGFRGVRFPRSATVVLSTFGTSSVVTTQVRRAMAGYLLITGVTVTAIAITAGSPNVVLAFQAPDAYHGEELVIACQDQEILFNSQWTVTVNGLIQAGPFSVVGGRAPLNLQTKRGDTVAVNVIPVSTDVFAVGMVVLVNGWTYPATGQSDGTYSRILRESPTWQRQENLQ